tara:strand:+ start:218 stop:349 length:132 start_codon:yes stop_codon:yes gene_type:complete
MTNQEIADQLKEIVVNQYSKEPEDRDWYAELGDLIDTLENTEA